MAISASRAKRPPLHQEKRLPAPASGKGEQLKPACFGRYLSIGYIQKLHRLLQRYLATDLAAFALLRFVGF